jgi:CHAD domain-containing protein
MARSTARSAADADAAMSFAFERGEPVVDAVRRVALEQLDGALHSLGDGLDDDVAEAPHDARKRCKKVRALVRLVRPAARGDTYRFTNDTLRDAARNLSQIRDAEALAATFEAVRAHVAMPDDEAARVGSALAARRQRMAVELHRDDPRIAEARAAIETVRDSVERWELREHGWPALGGGLALTYGRGRRGLGEVRRTATVENLHDWRKRAKYTWYHLRLVEAASPTLIGPMTRRFDELADVLGDVHDLHVLGAQLREGHDELAAAGDATEVLRRLDERGAELEGRAVGLGSRLYVEPARRFAARVGGYWEVWQELGDEPPPRDG